MKGTKQNIAQALAPIPELMRKEYILGGQTYQDVFDLASVISSWTTNEHAKGKPLCLATTDKALLMAAVLASLDGGPLLVLPASLADAVIAETCKMTGAGAVLTDQSIALPRGIRSVPLGKKKNAAPVRSSRRTTDKPFLWLYTGGSTGAPKLWPKTPDNLIGEALNLKNVFGIHENDILVSTVPPLHIYGLLFSVLLPFVSRASISGTIPYFPREIIRTVDRAKGTVFIGSPMHYRALATSSFHMTRLNHAFSSGGFLEESHSLHFTRATDTGVIEVYGSTETGGIATRCRAEGKSEWQPFSCVRWTIDNDRLSVASPFLSPNLPVNKKGFFTTGDKASDTGKGTFMLHGRADGIVKIGGKRVDMSVIEQKIKSLPSITDAWVLSLPSRSGREPDIAALVVTKKTLTYLRKAFARVLEPTHMPRRIVLVSAIPTTLSGKRDHQAALSVLNEQGNKA